MFEIVSLFGLMVSALLIINMRIENRLNLFLSLFFLSISVFSFTRNFIFYTNHPYILYYFIPGAIPFFNLSAPILYLYIKKSLIPDQPDYLTKKDYWHLLPFVISIINILPHVLLSAEVKLEFVRLLIQNPFKMAELHTLLFPIKINLLARPLLGIIYSVASLKIYFNYKERYMAGKTHTQVSLNWFVFLIVGAGLNFLSSFLIGVFAEVGAYKVQEVDEIKMLMLLPTMFLLILNTSIFFFPQILYGEFKRKLLKRENIPEKLVLNDYLNPSVRNFKGEDLVDSESTNALISQKLSEYFQSMPYLKPGFTLSTITQDTNIPYHQLTTYFNNHLGINFNDWKNNARIDYAIELIKNGQAKNLTFESIAFSCGFLSRSNFINSFRKKTGLTPSEYLKGVSAQPQEGMVIRLGFN